MTVIAALVTPNGAWMGGDSSSSTSDNLYFAANSKVIKLDNLLLGFAGSWGGGRKIFKFAEENPNLSLNDLVDSADFKDKTLDFLAIKNRHLYIVQFAGADIIEVTKSRGIAYAAIGSGESHVLGAFYASMKPDAGEDTVRVALEAAARFHPRVRSPFKIVSL